MDAFSLKNVDHKEETQSTQCVFLVPLLVLRARCIPKNHEDAKHVQGEKHTRKPNG
jgi:hypothetical protein